MSMAEEDAAKILKAKYKIHDVFRKCDPVCRRLVRIEGAGSGEDEDTVEVYDEDLHVHSAGCRSKRRRRLAMKMKAKTHIMPGRPSRCALPA